MDMSDLWVRILGLGQGKRTVSDSTTAEVQPEQVTIEPLRNEDGSVEWCWHIFGPQECLASGAAISLLEAIRSLADFAEGEFNDD